jgi:hypothetical protein
VSEALDPAGGLPAGAPTPGLAGRRCLNHPRREAAARCPECRHDFCRECVTDHGDRAICAACLAKLVETDSGRRKSAWARLLPGLSLLGGLATAWFYFYLIAQFLLLFPQAVDPTLAPGTGSHGAGAAAAKAAGPAPPAPSRALSGDRP